MKNKNILKKKLIEFTIIIATIVLFALHQILTQSSMQAFHWEEQF